MDHAGDIHRTGQDPSNGNTNSTTGIGDASLPNPIHRPARSTRATKTARPSPSRRYELRLYRAGVELVAGIDEVGRGCLAGPVLAAAVILPAYRSLRTISGVRDSKVLSPEERERLYHRIIRIAPVGIGLASHRIIDRYGIAPATRIAMAKAIGRLNPVPHHLLIDAVRVPLIDCEQTAIIDGDALCLSIAAASIVAKVTRDRLMDKASLRYPGYGFENHKGYGTPEHHDGLIKMGPCAIHRLTFRPAFARCAIAEIRPEDFQLPPMEPGQAGLAYAGGTAGPRRGVGLIDLPGSGGSDGRTLGAFGETYATHFLRRRGYQILDRNVRFPCGEIDIVARDDDQLIFVEVKSRRSTIHALPEDSITDERMGHLESAIDAYLSGRDLPYRIEVIAIEINTSGRVSRCAIVPDVGLR